MEMGADYLATGHYARVAYDKQSDRFILKRGVDAQKDQSYFLYMLNQSLLRSLLLPIGEKTKKEVKALARHEGLRVSEQSESQEICFIPGKDYRMLFRKNGSSAKPGPVVDRTGKKLGQHTGIINYTIGQRRGLGIAAARPYYVTKLQLKENTIVVGPRKEAYSNELVAEDVHWITDPVKKGETVGAKIRSLHNMAKARVFPLSAEKVRVVFEKPQWAIAPGQSVVFYKKDRVMGGGIIVNGKNETAGTHSRGERERQAWNEKTRN
jgi:tRNA-specific 2-thiouridylase